MMTAERHYDGELFLAMDIRGAIKRRLRELGGLAVIAAVGTAAAALATWSINDPSFSHATRAPIRNLLGAPGAITADLAMQLLGLATLAMIVPAAFWGWRLFTHRPLDRIGWRFATWIGGGVFAAGYASCLPRTAHWPLPTGIGGVVGDALLRVIVAIAGGPLHGVGHTVAEVVFGSLGLAAIVTAAGFGFHRDAGASATSASGDGGDQKGRRNTASVQEADEDIGSVSLGWLIHGFLSLRARAGLAAKRCLGEAGVTIAALLRRPALGRGARVEPGWIPARVRVTTRSLPSP